LPIKLDFQDYPYKSSRFWPANWSATLKAVCVDNPTAPLASITWGYNIAADGTVTMSPKAGDGNPDDCGKIVVTVYEPQDPGTGGAHIEAYYIGCCDSGLNWVQTITADSKPLDPNQTFPSDDCMTVWCPYYFGPPDCCSTDWWGIDNHISDVPESHCH
jgi:hypothetical protein